MFNTKLNTSFRKTLLTVIGVLSLIAGIIGIFVPVWPTTCFLLIACTCFSKSSSRLYDWMLSNRLFGKYLRDYQEHRIISRKAKAWSISFLWMSLFVSILFTGGKIWLAMVLLSIGVTVTLHVARTRSLRPVEA